MDSRPTPPAPASRSERLAELAGRLQLRRRAVPLFLQSEAAECGLACLAMVAHAHGHRIDLAALRRRFPASLRGMSLRALLGIASTLNLAGRSLRVDLPQLSRLKAPCILHWDLNHFVVLVKVRGDRVVVHDPALGRRSYRLAEVSRHFTGVALELTPTSEFKPIQEQQRARIQDLWSRVQGLGSSLGAVFAFSALLQVFTVAGPFYTQFVVDEVLSRGDRALLLVLGLGFGLVLALRTAVSFLRDYTVLYASQLLSFQMGANLLSHLVRLPMAYFEKRHLGDLLSRVRSLDPIEELLTTGFVGAILDGVMALIVLALMFAYSAKLALLALGVSALFSALRVALYRPIRQLREEGIAAQAKQDMSLIEMLRGMQAVKLLGAESLREAHWQNRCAAALNASMRVSRWELSFKTLNALLFGAEALISVALAAQLVLDQQFSVGMLYAFAAYKTQFTDRISALIDWAIRYRMLDVHLGRLADIVHTQEEPGLRESESELELRGRIELRNVGFRYAESDACVLQGVSLSIEAGSRVGIVGRSGSGKTTLLKLLLGLLEPSEGEIWVDGRRLESAALRGYRRQIGSVMQDDHFFEGTLAENISAFDPDEDPARIEAAARTACIHGDIAALPMGYRTWIGTMGSNLSGGQRQRILLARAFYREPRLLVLDEGTANLDPALVGSVAASIAALPITRIIATHQHSVLEGTDRVFLVEGGKVGELESAGALSA